ncbi:TPA: polysaccharide pyruvyl transferase family protein [Vibrio parahaemolyticus]|nr:polysaccharide pyruvyl transferase family protein [Vibrio parahaemolyticus]EJA3098193.1 polysaccharide pyruvyl transferase family protein [Vibrio parahaemolyticus]ELA9382934.1 polysaccharide pyruvyl transferase family protein [Vibrio parahaemolyticus]HAV1371401.1 polysaccharide pyruvyl transferase family protein [Vibrio parahaemolyticus]HCE2193991.1 polysaccharide pyruvyl transferase family protein [Vibrio parahaemolyticus]
MNMKKVGIVGTYGRIDGCAFLNTDKLLSKVGQNTGNLLFQYAVTNAIKEEKVIIGTDVPWDVELVKETCRVIVIPSANFIREGFDFSGFVDFLDNTGLPLVFLGLGAQAKDYQQTEFDFHPSIEKLIHLVKERCVTAGLRGSFTKNLLERFGVTNTEIIGCPTNFINQNEKFIENLEKKWNRDIFSFVATGDEPWPSDLTKRDAERQMIQWISEGNGIYLQQSVAPFIRYARQNNSSQTESVPEHHEESLRASIAPDMSTTQFRAFVATKMRLYYSVDQWMEDSARFDFSIGLRLHGNMAAWQSGTPAIWIYHDSRTRELAETMCLPHISHTDFLAKNSLTELRDSIDFSFEKYSSQRNLLKERYRNILNDAGIKSELN